MEEEKKTKKFNKKYLMFGLPILCLALVAAGFLVSTLTLNVGVAEAFEVEYAILGDGGTYTGGVEGCNGATYYSNENIEIAQGDESDTMQPGESRFICVKIENGAGVIPYEITAVMDGGNVDNTALCVLAFGTPDVINGDAEASDGSVDGITYDGFVVTAVSYTHLTLPTTPYV